MKKFIYDDNMQLIKEIHYHNSGLIKKVLFWKNSKCHRVSGPAKILYNKDGSVRREIYVYQNIKFNSLKDLQMYVKTLCIN